MRFYTQSKKMALILQIYNLTCIIEENSYRMEMNESKILGSKLTRGSCWSVSEKQG